MNRDPDKHQKYHRITDLIPVESLSATEVAVQESEIRKLAPVRHCWCCGKLLRKRSYRTNSGGTLKLGLVAYGWKDSGFWCSPKCIADHASVLGSIMVKISKSSIFGNDGWDLSRRALNYKREVFPA